MACRAEGVLREGGAQLGPGVHLRGVAARIGQVSDAIIWLAWPCLGDCASAAVVVWLALVLLLWGAS